jgi:hypothetical protein
VPGAIITDRESVFVSYFWTTLFEMMGTDCVATTAYNPEADGQSGRTNRTIEIALRHVVNANQDNWVDFLGEIQLAANNAVNASTKMPPNEALKAYLPKGAVNTLVPVPVTVQHNQKGRDLQEMKSAIMTKREEARDALAFAEFAMAAQYDISIIRSRSDLPTVQTSSKLRFHRGSMDPILRLRIPVLTVFRVNGSDFTHLGTSFHRKLFDCLLKSVKTGTQMCKI